MNTVTLNESLFANPEAPPALTSPSQLQTELTEALDAAASLNPRLGMELIRVSLYHARKKSSNELWKWLLDKVILAHPMAEICHKDPFTYRAFSKPRGYAGDAIMIDYVYGYYDEADLEDPETALVNSVSVNSPSTRAVRNRLHFIVNKLGEVVESKNEPEIFSVACGHCREFGHCKPLHSNPPKRFVAFDQDAESLNLVEREYGNLGVTPMHGSVSSLLKNRGPEGQFDLVYALGLYDYLNQRAAQRLTKNLFYRLHQGGELVVANFRPDIIDIGYMESYMAWELIFRDRAEMLDLCSEIEPNDIAETNVFMEPERNIIFLSLKRK